MASRTRENLLRRMAARQGYRLTKTRRRDPLALDYGHYGLLDGEQIVNCCGVTLEAIEQYLLSDPRRAALSRASEKEG